ncbi:MAG: phosphoenolpyruvate--protein phosphotransferase [Gemmatimonadota bacterium]
MTTSASSSSGGEPLVIVAPLSGIIVPLDRVPDPAFAQRLVGDGISIDPMSERVLAPCDATVLQVHRASHAVTLSARGLEIIVHVGLDTVMLKGDGFTALVKSGDIVRSGDPLLSFDADLVARRARSLLTQVIVSNVERVSSIQPSDGFVTAGRDTLMRIMLNATSDSAAASTSPDGQGANAVRSRPIVITAAGGLHARPAAMIAAAARRFAAELRLLKGTREANARSVVSIMALEAGEGEEITVAATGSDAAAAIDAISRLLAGDAPSDAGPSPGSAPARTAAPAAPPLRQRPDEPGLLRGVPASPGVAVGKVHHLRHEEAVVEEHAADPQQERRALDAALASAHAQLGALRAGLSANPDRAAIFAAHEELLGDPELLEQASAGIREGGSAAWAWKRAYTAQAGRLLALRNELFAGRAADMRDVGSRVLHILSGAHGVAPEIPPESIIVAEDLAPSDAASLDRTRVRGFCTTSGSATSHAAILARGLGIPAVAGIDARVLDLAPGTRVILDGDAGVLRPEPSDAEVETIARRREADEGRRGRELAVSGEPATTIDGHRIHVYANIGDTAEAAAVVQAGAEGVGLLRSEFLFMRREHAPNEDEQAQSYASIASALGPDRILVIRTLDVGGDKPLTYLPMAAEANPFLGERGIRLTLNRPEIFRAQIRAILRAASSGKVAIMFPMIATLAEWRRARELVEAERALLGTAPIPIGIMVETPAAAVMADQFAREADFLSIGTNDLTQYTLCMDRGNPQLAPQLDALDPAVLRLIAQTAKGGHEHKRWVSVCGALAGDPDAVPVLLGLGVDDLSVDIPVVPAVKARVRSLSMLDCRAIARAALDADDGAGVRAIVARHRA